MGKRGNGEEREWGGEGMGKRGNGEKREWGGEGMGRRGNGEGEVITYTVTPLTV